MRSHLFKLFRCYSSKATVSWYHPQSTIERLQTDKPLSSIYLFHKDRTHTVGKNTIPATSGVTSPALTSAHIAAVVAVVPQLREYDSALWQRTHGALSDQVRVFDELCDFKTS